MNDQQLISDNDILEQLEIAETVDQEVKDSLVVSVRQAVSLRFSQAVSDLMTESQLEEFEQKQNAGTAEEELSDWLATTVPDYVELKKAMYGDVIDELKDRLGAIGV